MYRQVLYRSPSSNSTRGRFPTTPIGSLYFSTQPMSCINLLIIKLLIVWIHFVAHMSRQYRGRGPLPYIFVIERCQNERPAECTRVPHIWYDLALPVALSFEMRLVGNFHADARHYPVSPDRLHHHSPASASYITKVTRGQCAYSQLGIQWCYWQWWIMDRWAQLAIRNIVQATTSDFVALAFGFVCFKTSRRTSTVS